MAHLHSFTLTQEAHEVVNQWFKGSRSGNVSYAVTMYAQHRDKVRDHLKREADLEKFIRTLTENIEGLQSVLTAKCMEIERLEGIISEAES
jgi:predicted RNase H-like nuclease (RuvC/YqgF family)